MKELQRPQSGGAGRSSRFLSDDSADAYCKAPGGREDGSSGFPDGFTDWTLAAAPSSKVFNGNMMSETCFLPEFAVCFVFFQFIFVH